MDSETNAAPSDSGSEYQHGSASEDTSSTGPSETCDAPQQKAKGKGKGKAKATGKSSRSQSRDEAATSKAVEPTPPGAPPKTTATGSGQSRERTPHSTPSKTASDPPYEVTKKYTPKKERGDYSFSPDVEVDLAVWLHEHPQLWDTSNEGYRDQDLLRDTWQQGAEQFNCTGDYLH